MSEPLASHDPEDVLSSIRRLVLDDPGTGPEPSGEADPALASAAEAPGKLLLTPALRVVGGEADRPASDDNAARSRSPSPAGEAEAVFSFGEAAPLGAAPLRWEEPAPAEGASDTGAELSEAEEPPPAEVSPAEPAPALSRLTLSTPAAEEEGEDPSPIAVFTAVPRPAPLLLTPKDQGEAEAVPFMRHPRSAQRDRESVVIDEMALRALLRQIVREELAALQLKGGEAPDMRRMVRLELQRALTGES